MLDIEGVSRRGRRAGVAVGRGEGPQFTGRVRLIDGKPVRWRGVKRGSFVVDVGDHDHHELSVRMTSRVCDRHKECVALGKLKIELCELYHVANPRSLRDKRKDGAV